MKIKPLYQFIKKLYRRKMKWIYHFLIQISALFLVSHSLAFGGPAIKITNMCPYGNPDCMVSGVVSGVDNYANYYVAPYIQVDELWWTKPTVASPRCSIKSNGTFTCDITTGGCDQYATAVKAYLMPQDTDPTICFDNPPCFVPPENPSAVASTVEYRPYPRGFAFSGYTWRVKQAPACKLGPGPNYFAADNKNVWVDDKGLHLRIRKSLNKWYSSEVVLQHTLGYGTYIFHLNSRVDTIDPNMVIGLFTWDSIDYHPAHREMDIEFARWGDPNEFDNAQFVLQPCSQCPGCGDNCSRFRVDLTDKDKKLTLYMIWKPGSVEFRAYKGHYWENPPAESLIHEWVRTGNDVPEPAKENIRFNFWLVDGNPPSNKQDAEVIIQDFVFSPPCISNCQGKPTIEFTYVPPIGSSDNLIGQVWNVKPDDYKVAVYIFVSSGWWTKPSWADPLTPIQADGYWVTDITTGGVDETATKIAAFLVPNGYDPPSMSGDGALPQSLYDNALANVETSR